MVPQHLVNQVFRGASKFNSVVGHKIIRYAASIPFEQTLQGLPDYRVKKFEGGLVELGEVLGIGGRRQHTELREIMYALKHLEITNIKDSTMTKGRLIDVAHFRSKKTGREDGLILTVLPTLVSLGEFDPRGILLVPMATIAPPIKGIASTQYHAALYYLQMIIIGEFCDKSVEYAKHRCIKITEKDWNRMLIASNIPEKFKDKIVENWTKGGDDAPRVLERVAKDQFTLGEAYQKVSDFFIEQGCRREKQKRRGEASVQKRKKK